MLLIKNPSKQQKISCQNKVHDESIDFYVPIHEKCVIFVGKSITIKAKVSLELSTEEMEEKFKSLKAKRRRS